MTRANPFLRFQSVVVLLAVLLILLSSCNSATDDTDNASAADNGVSSAEVNQSDNASQSSTAAEPGSAQEASQQDQTTPADSTQADNSLADITPASIPADDSALSQLLLTDYTVVENQIVPISSWICTDVFNQNRALYFFSEGVLDDSRRVSIERTLYDNNSSDDIAFFWSVSASDAIIMSSATVSESGGALLSTGQQYDVSSIRFFEVESRLSFTAHSVLRGQITCALFDIQ